MNPEQAAAFVYALSVSAIAEIEAMKAANESRRRNGAEPKYTEDDFRNAVVGVGHNSVLEIFQHANR